MRMTRKRCCFCGRWYVPDRRVGDRQRTCSRRVCRKRRKGRANRKWHKENPGYEKGMRDKRKVWREAHPGYWRRYRSSHPEYVARDNARRERARRGGKCAAKQDEIRAKSLDRLRVLEGWITKSPLESAAKQDKIPPPTPCEEKVFQWMEGVVAYLFWKEGAAKQDAIAFTPGDERDYAYASGQMGRDEATEPG